MMAKLRYDFTETVIALAGFVSAALYTPYIAFAQGIEANLLKDKAYFHALEDKAVSEGFTGIRTSEGLIENLYPLRVTGVSTEPVQDAANSFLASLSPTQLIRSHLPMDDLEWRRWLNVDNGIYARKGTPIAEMHATQRQAAMGLLATTLSARGVAQSRAIMLTDQALKELNPELAPYYGSDLYYFTVMGTPSADEPWGWQLDGHHLVINAFLLGDQMVMTPTFWGGEPAITRQGSASGNEVLQAQQDLGLALAQSLQAEQLSAAILDPAKTGDNILAGAYQDNRVIDYAGLAATNMSGTQRDTLVALIESYVGAMRAPHAAVRLKEVVKHLDETRLVWIGGTEDDSVFYYRIHSPVILIEFDHQIPVGTTMLNTPGQPTRDHIHTVVRTPNGNDYGRDLLAQHLATAHAH
jgi:hypothetical protein